MAMDDNQKEAGTLIRKAQDQLGISELMRAYGRYGEVMEQTQAYMDRNKYISQHAVNTNSSSK